MNVSGIETEICLFLKKSWKSMKAARPVER